jgi:CheY-like chemotaxis protein/cytidylate kinase
MPIIMLFSGSFCGKETVVEELVDSTGYTLITDDDVVKRVEALTGVSESKIRRAFTAKTSVFNKFTHEKECSIAHLRYSVAEIMADDGLVIDGFSGLLIPRTIDHVLRICLIAEMPYRVERARAVRSLTEKEALKVIRNEDGDRAAWVNTLFSNSDPWAEDLYDIVIPMNRVDTHQASSLIGENLLKDAVHKTELSEKAYQDFLLASRTEAVLCKAGHDVTVEADRGEVLVSVNKHVLMLGRLEEELKAIAENVSGVTSVKTKVGKDFHKADIYRKHNFEVPSRVLLVDDEREFVQTLSERLQLRDMGSAIAYDGKSALEIIKEDDPEVIIIDLKMPDVDGIEVLKKVKKQRPEIEVIVLTGHGSESDKKKCMKLGAFDYIQKPVDIDHLGDVLKKAHDKIRKKTEND